MKPNSSLIQLETKKLQTFQTKTITVKEKTPSNQQEIPVKRLTNDFNASFDLGINRSI